MENISSYGRPQALKDGMLLDVSSTPEAREAGFKIPVCITPGVVGLVEVPQGLEGFQDVKGRLWDTLYLAVMAFKKAEDKFLVPFEISYMMAPHRHEVVSLWMCFSEHEGFTIMRPEEY